MENRDIITLIDIAIEKLNQFIEESKFERTSQRRIIGLLVCMKEKLELGEEIPERWLRGYKDVCTSTAIHFEEASYEDSIFDVKHALEKRYPFMKDLKLLGTECWKEYPV